MTDICKIFFTNLPTTKQIVMKDKLHEDVVKSYSDMLIL